MNISFKIILHLFSLMLLFDTIFADGGKIGFVDLPKNPDEGKEKEEKKKVDYEKLKVDMKKNDKKNEELKKIDEEIGKKAKEKDNLYTELNNEIEKMNKFVPTKKDEKCTPVKKGTPVEKGALQSSLNIVEEQLKQDKKGCCG